MFDAISNLRKIQQETLAKATPGTIVWLLECEEFRLFIDVDGILKVLWGSGMRMLRLNAHVVTKISLSSSWRWKDGRRVCNACMTLELTAQLGPH